MLREESFTIPRMQEPLKAILILLAAVPVVLLAYCAMIAAWGIVLLACGAVIALIAWPIGFLHGLLRR